jgi:hypothetical protein
MANNLSIMNYNYQPLILIGAARSGTKLVRDIISCHPSIDRVPYDINYIWKFGNEDLNHDELQIERLNDKIRSRIIQSINRSSRGAPYLIEKTVSNCLRVPYVTAVFPNAKFLHLVRNGFDAVESVFRQWNAPPNWKYILQKTFTFPLYDAFSYGASYGGTVIKKLIPSHGKSTLTWGVRYDGIDEDVRVKSLLEVCAIQWSRSVSGALNGLDNVPSQQKLTIQYEDFVLDPHSILEEVAVFLACDSDPFSRRLNLSTIRKDEIGKGMRSLPSTQIQSIFPFMERELRILGYI